MVVFGLLPPKREEKKLKIPIIYHLKNVLLKFEMWIKVIGGRVLIHLKRVETHQGVIADANLKRFQHKVL